MAVTAVTDADFDQMVRTATKPVLVDFWATWCSPCKQIAPILEELSEAYGDRMTFVKVNADENPTATTTQGVRSLPTLQIIVNGEIVRQFIGAKSKKVLIDAIEEHI